MSQQPEPTPAARGIRLKAIRQRDAVHAEDALRSHTCPAALDRRWLLGEVDRLTRERDQANERLTAVVADYERDITT